MSRDDQLNFGAEGEGARVSMPSMRTARSRIPCSPECPSFPRSALCGPIPISLVTDAQGKFLRISELDLQWSGRKVQTVIVYGLISNAINVITDDSVHVSGIADHRKLNRSNSVLALGHIRSCLEVGDS